MWDLLLKATSSTDSCDQEVAYVSSNHCSDEPLYIVFLNSNSHHYYIYAISDS